MDLHELHRSQITRFTTWFAGKRSKAVGDRDIELEDFKSDRLADESAIFNYSDMAEVLDAYHQQVMGRFREEMEKTVNLSSVYVSQLLSQAEAHGVVLQVDDISAIEDQSRLDQLHSLTAMNAPPLAPKPRQSLQAMGSSLGGAENVALLQQVQELQEDKRALEERYTRVEAELSNISRERAQLSQEVSRLSLANSTATMSSDAQVHQYALQLQETQTAYEQLRQENEQIGREVTERLANSAQFRQLKAICKSKSDEVKELKQRLMSAGLMPPETSFGHVELAADSD